MHKHIQINMHLAFVTLVSFDCTAHTQTHTHSYTHISLHCISLLNVPFCVWEQWTHTHTQHLSAVVCFPDFKLAHTIRSLQLQILCNTRVFFFITLSFWWNGKKKLFLFIFDSQSLFSVLFIFAWAAMQLC